jgi:hypothetical protein
VAYTSQVRIANRNEATRVIGTEQNPERYENRSESKQTDSTQSSSGVTTSVSVSKDDPGVTVTSSTDRTESSTQEGSSGSSQAGTVSNTTGALRDLIETTNIMIVNYLNKNGDANGDIRMTVITKNGSRVNGSFSRDSVKDYLDTFVNNVRTAATCDTSPRTCSPPK